VAMVLQGYARKSCEVEKICDAKKKSGLKPPPLVVDNTILTKFLLSLFTNNYKILNR
jgi:hypothetical protein